MFSLFSRGAHLFQWLQLSPSHLICISTLPHPQRKLSHVCPGMTCHACPLIQHLGIPFCSLLPSSLSVYYIIILGITDFLSPLYGSATSDLFTSPMNYCNSLQGAFPVPGTLFLNAFCYHPWPIFYTPFSHVTSVASISLS